MAKFKTDNDEMVKMYFKFESNDKWLHSKKNVKSETQIILVTQ